MTDDGQFTNHLADETSPYLLQHAHNPVEWYPWGDEAFEKAKGEDKPILLSIGYSACHWCHVMAHESFEDEAIAALMNENFVNVKVDREERPDLDQIYMNAVQMMTHHGGWPMTVFLTPEGVPFYGGTYFPPKDRYNMAGFPRVLISVAEAYRERREDINETSAALLKELQRLSETSRKGDVLDNALLDGAYVGAIRNYDTVNGGFGGAPKFPPAMTLEFLLRVYARSRKEDALKMVQFTCRQMADGGIYDQLGGGFHRYATDARWLVPHFEKMLYDNALLSRLYLHTYQISGSQEDRAVVEGILNYVIREMTDTSGGFYSTQDADSEGHEGKFFVWTIDEIKSVLAEDDARIFIAFFNVTEAGNFEGKNILNVTKSLDEVAVSLKRPVAEVRESIERSRQKLFKLRETRVKPDRDDKILTAWNGLMMASFAEAGVILSEPRFTEVARRNADFILTKLVSDRQLLRVYKDGRARLNGYLEDYAFLSEALLTLYETTGEERWLNEALTIVDTMVREFWDEDGGGFYFTGKSHEALIVRTKDYYDNATPSGNSVAALVLLRLAVLMDNERYRSLAVAVLREISEPMKMHPTAFGYALAAVDFLLGKPKEIAIVDGTGTAALEFINETWKKYLPNKVIATLHDETSSSLSIPLLKERKPLDGQTTAYVCENYTCRQPVTSVAEFSAQLESKL